MRRRAVLASVLALALLCAGPAAAATPACPVVPETATPEAAVTLAHVAEALKSGRLDVLAIGSGTVLGARGQAEGSFADRMVQDLRSALPETDIRLTVQGERGMTAAAMLAALRRTLDGRRFALVVWQTGTVEAVRKLPAEELARTLDAGAETVRQEGGDLLLVDPQYSRMLMAHTSLDPYREVMQQAARRHAALLFRRFDLIRAWAETGPLDLESAARPDRTKMAERLNACLGTTLARMVLRAAGLGTAGLGTAGLAPP